VTQCLGEREAGALRQAGRRVSLHCHGQSQRLRRL
jgi:hypothetical protein